MKKIKNIFVLMFTFMLVSVFGNNAFAAEITTSDIVSNFNKLAESLNTTPDYSLTANLCSAEEIAAEDCSAGDIVITTVNQGSTSKVYYEANDNVISASYLTEEDSVGLLLLIRSIGNTNNFNYDNQELLATFNSEEILDYTLEDEGFEVTETSIEGAFNVAIDMTKKLPTFSSKTLSVDIDFGGEISVTREGEESDFYSQVHYETLKEGSVRIISAKENEGYKFSHWTLNGEEYSNDKTIKVTVNKDMEIVAHFDEIEIELTKITGAEIKLVAPIVGEEIKKVINKDEYGEWEEQSSYPEVSTETKGLLVNAFWVKGLKELNEESFYGTFEKDTYYYVLIDFETKYGYELAEDFPDNLKVNGVKPEEVFEVQMGTWNHCIVKIKAKEAVTEYKILDGNNQTFEIGKDITIRANGELENLKKLKMDDNELDPSNYTSKIGSTIVILKASYLSTLSAGNHTLTFVYNDGEIDATFTIPTNTTNNPKTGDNIISYISLFGLSIIGLVILRKYSNRKLFN